MGRKAIVYKKEVLLFFNDLIYELYTFGYFSFKESAKKYTRNILKYIEQNIENAPKKIPPMALNHIGSYYIFYKASNYTTWYIFFDVNNDKYIIGSIFNNHYYLAKYLN